MQRDVIYRARCIPKYYFSNTEKLLAYVKEIENKELQNVSLHTEVENIKCKEDVQRLSVSDYFVL